MLLPKSEIIKPNSVGSPESSKWISNLYQFGDSEARPPSICLPPPSKVSVAGRRATKTRRRTTGLSREILRVRVTPGVGMIFFSQMNPGKGLITAYISLFRYTCVIIYIYMFINILVCIYIY